MTDITNQIQISDLLNNNLTYGDILPLLYDRLYQIDTDASLPALLETKNTLGDFNFAFNKIACRQKEEIVYLQDHHPALFLFFTLEENELLNTLPITLEALEKRHEILENLNAHIIQSEINKKPNLTELNLNYKHITRFNLAKLQENNNPNYWENLTALYCQSNLLTILNVESLKNLRGLAFEDNKVTTLKVKGLDKLVLILCSNNLLTRLDLAGLSSLEELFCHNLQLTHINLKNCEALRTFDFNEICLKGVDLEGVREELKKQYAYLEEDLKAKQHDFNHYLPTFRAQGISLASTELKRDELTLETESRKNRVDF